MAKLKSWIKRRSVHSRNAYPFETEHLSRRVLDKNLVNDISVQVRSGGILAIVGASGAGGRAFHGA